MVFSDVATPTIPDPNADMQNRGKASSANGTAQLYQAGLEILPFLKEE